MTGLDRATCATLAALLRAGALLGHWSLALSTAAALALALRELGTVALFGCSVTLLLGLPERYLALRLRLDERLFDRLAQGGVESLAALDAALARLGLRSAAGVPRGLDERLLGTRRWMRRHAWLVAGQTLAFLLALAALHGA
ncbi:hypothetical protein [Pseudorhodoferax sp.]|uniref:hypothetical protein n=1 Tax=Pseudorhodoferax sp. TaxID=1993553 RepID=UPI002DD634D2|nr:hypothetical protein [Pseudorhodoferax sp.]